MRSLYLKRAFKSLVSLIAICIFSLSPAWAQMRQMYLDADEDNDIRKISFYSPDEGYVAFADWIGYTADGGRTYTKKYITVSNVNYGSYTNINITFGFGIEGVKAFDKNTLIVYGEYGLVPAILYSTDGGNSFKLVFHSQYSPEQLRTGIKDVVFPQNDDIGYAVDADRILKTTDKGMNWSVQTVQSGAYFDHLEAVDNNNLIAISTNHDANRLLKTSNGGTSWLRISLPKAGKLTYAYFLNANVGWLSMYDDEYLYFYKTTNGGQQWTLQNDVNATPFNCGKMRFTDVNTGYALVAPYRVYKTTNSGVTWEPLLREYNFTYLGYSHYDLQCLSATQLWAGGGHGYLEMTDNGGGAPVPAAYFKIDTTGMYVAGNVQLLNFSKKGYRYQWLVNGSLVSTSYNASYIHDIARSVDTIQLIVSAGEVSDTLRKFGEFYAGGLPKISSYYPKLGSTGTFVRIFGSTFSKVSGVSFGGTPAASFAVLSDTVITAVVAGGATGPITLKQFYGSVPVGEFTYRPPSDLPPPVIKTVSPSAGMIGSAVTISGSGFSATAAQNRVFFGTVQAELQSVASGQIVCTVPVGASLGTIQVFNKDNGLLGESPLPFHVPFADSTENFTPNSFTENLIVYEGGQSPNVAQGEDIDGDGKPDLIVTTGIGQGDSLVVYRNTTKGKWISFAPRVNVGYRYYSSSDRFAINDLDGDGRPDIVLPANEKFVKVYRNVSSPGLVSFEDEYVIPAGWGTQQTVVTDLDNDGKNDIAVAIFTDHCVSVIRNTSVPGYLSFGATQNLEATSTPVDGIDAGDLDGDGLKDLVVLPTDIITTGMLLYRNTSTRGRISFDPFINISVPGVSFQGRLITIVDYDMDGKPDVVICNDDYICVLLNSSTTGNFSFLPPVVMPLAGLGTGGCLSNFSGSVRPDVVSGNYGSIRKFIMAKNSSLPGIPKIDSLAYGPGDRSTPVFVRSVDAADFDGDGKPDLATTSDYNRVIIYKNTVGVPVIMPMCTSRQDNALESDISGHTYQWQQDTGSGFTNVVNSTNVSGGTAKMLRFKEIAASWNGYKYRCLVDGRYSSTFEVLTDYTARPGLILTSTYTTFCLGTDVTFTAVDSSGHKNYTWQWQINGSNTGYNTNTFSTVLLKDLDQVRVIQEYFDVCGFRQSDTSNVITVHVNGSTASVQITASDIDACMGTPVTFTATPVNPGEQPVYDWKVNGESQRINNSIFTSSRLRKSDRVQVVMKSAATCAYPNPAQSNVITMAVTDTSALSIRIDTYTPSTCSGANVYFSSTTRSAGPVSDYQWTVNGVPAGINVSSFVSATLRDKDVVQCVLTSPSACRVQTQATSQSITMTVSSFEMKISGDTAVIAAGLKAHLTATHTYSGVDLQYQWQDSTESHTWQDINWASNVTIDYAPVKSGDKIRCVGRSALRGCTAISNAIAIRIHLPTATPETPSLRADYRWYPNPVSTMLYVDDKNRGDLISTITVFNSSGVKALVMNNADRQEKISIDMSTLPGGLYFVETKRRSGKVGYLKVLKVR